MAGEYSINLTNGSVLTTVHPLEVDGGVSTPRQVVSITFPSTIKLNGRLSYRFVPGFTFNFININNPSDPNIGSYTVLSSSETGLITDPDSIVFTNIIVTTTIPNVSSIPFGQVQYSIPASTSIHLGGRGIMNWAEDMLESSIHIAENFANTTAPGNPLTGQHWYRTLSGSEGMLIFDGSAWISSLDVDTGELRFKDSQDTNVDIILSASAPGDNDYGLSLRPSLTSAPPTLSLFRVVDDTSTVEYLRVERGGYVRMYNSLEVKGVGDSYIYNRLGVGDGGIPSVTNTLTVEGSGIDVNSAAGFYANLNLNAPANMKSQVSFISANLVKSEIFVDGASVGTPLEINNSINTNVHIVSGTSTGNVGIGNSNPQAKLDVTGSIQAGSNVADFVQINPYPLTASIKMGNVIVASTPFIDFHSSGNNIGHDSRISASGGTGVIGQGTINIQAANTVISQGPLNMSTNQITNVATPTSDADATTKKYVDDQIALAFALAVIAL